MIAILISSSLLILCYTLYRGQYKKILLREQQFERQKECLDFFTKISPFIHIASNFKQKDTRTLVLDLFPCEENTPRRPLEIQVNGNKQNKATLLIISRHIQEFSWFYWDSDKNNWVKFENGKTYSNLRFIKVTLLDKNKQISAFSLGYRSKLQSIIPIELIAYSVIILAE